MLEWKKYDPENPPEIDKAYLVTNGTNVDIGWLAKYFDNEPAKWYVPDVSSLDDSSITHFAPINLPTEDISMHNNLHTPQLTTELYDQIKTYANNDLPIGHATAKEWLRALIADKEVNIDAK